MSEPVIIGNATLYLGDCRFIVPGLETPCSIITDPPYGVGINYGENYNDKRKDYWEWLAGAINTFTENMGTVIFTHRVTALKYLKDWDWIGVWNKPGAFGARLGNSCVLPHWEPIFMYGIHGAGVKTEYTADVFTFNPQPAKANITGIGREKWEKSLLTDHPCPKPTALYDQLVKAFGQGTDTICDPFMGSGTTAISAMNLGKKFIGIEIEPKFFDIACRRIEDAQRQSRLFA